MEGFISDLKSAIIQLREREMRACNPSTSDRARMLSTSGRGVVKTPRSIRRAQVTLEGLLNRSNSQLDCTTVTLRPQVKGKGCGIFRQAFWVWGACHGFLILGVCEATQAATFSLSNSVAFTSNAPSLWHFCTGSQVN